MEILVKQKNWLNRKKWLNKKLVKEKSDLNRKIV